MRARQAVSVFALAVSVLAAACSGGGDSPAAVVPGASASVGEDLIVRFGCGSCHVIPGVKGADGLVAPPLTSFGRRQFIAGRLANTPENLVRWIVDPKGVDPETAMPALGVSPEQARDMAAYLEQLG